jgi:hypothetical protein
MILLIILIVLAVIALSYLITTGLVWLVLWLLQELFNITLDLNLWLLGLLVWIVLSVLSATFKK